jgi:hypothetical protein
VKYVIAIRRGGEAREQNKIVSYDKKLFQNRLAKSF